MTSNAIKQELVSLIFEMFKDNGLDIDAIEFIDLIDDLGMDSITFISIVIEVESHFNIIVPDEMLLIENFKRIDDIVAIVTSQLLNKITEEVMDV